MKPNVLRTPLINSAIILFIFSMLVYFTTSSPEGSVWSSIGAIVMLILRAVQLGIGLALGLLVCLVVMIGIFLGSVALFNVGTASRMYEGLRRVVLAWTATLAGLFQSDRKENLESRFQDFGAEMKQDMAAIAQGARSEVGSTRSELEAKLMTMSSRLGAIEESSQGMASTEQVAELATEVSGSGETLTRLESSVKTVQDGLNKVEQQVQDITPEKLLGDIAGRVETLEQQDVGAQVDLQPIEGGRLMLRPVPTSTTLSLSSMVDGLHVAPWPRIYVDLRSSGVRGEEAAEHLREVVNG